VMILQPDLPGLPRDEEILAALGYEPVGFRDPSEAMRSCHAPPGRFDAVLICPHSRTNLALESAAQLHEIAPAMPIIIATPSARDLDPAELAAAGVSELIPYPLQSSALSNALWRCLTVPDASVLP
jgi:hypothetical protein